jgi:phage tail-like protein
MTALVPRTEALPDRVGKSRRSPQWLLNQLPVGMLDSDFFVRFVSIFQHIGTTLLEDADNIDYLVDASVTPEPMLRWLASWIGTDALDDSLDPTVKRRIVAGAATALTWRGTVTGLRRYLALICGGAVEVEDGGGVWRDGEAPTDTAWVRIKVESTGWLAEDDFVALIRDEIPAHVRAELFVNDRCIWPADEEGTP